MLYVYSDPIQLPFRSFPLPPTSISLLLDRLAESFLLYVVFVYWNLIDLLSCLFLVIVCSGSGARRSRHSTGLFEFVCACGHVHILFAIDLDATSEIEQLYQTEHHTIANGR